MEEKIIKYVRENPILWNKRYSGRKNIKLKDKKWNKIATILGISDEAVKKRWKTIRDRYYRISKQEDSISAAANKQSHVTKYKYADMLEFLKGTSGRRKSSFANNNSDNSNTNTNCHELIVENDENYLKCEYIGTIEETQPGNNYESLTMDHIENNLQVDSISHITPKISSNDLQQQHNDVMELKHPNNLYNSPAHLFMMSLALQIENAKLSTESFLNLQIKILKLVKEELKQKK